MIEILVFSAIGVICSLIANAPALLVADNVTRVVISSRRVLALLVAQAVLFAGYGLLLGYLQRIGRVTSLFQALLLGAALGVVPLLFGYWPVRRLISSIAIGLMIVACSAAAFLLSPIVRAD